MSSKVLRHVPTVFALSLTSKKRCRTLSYLSLGQYRAVIADTHEIEPNQTERSFRRLVSRA